MRDAVRGLFQNVFKGVPYIGTFQGQAIKPSESELATIEPGEDLRLGPTHVYRLTVGHLVSSEPMRRLGLGKAASEARAAEGKKGMFSRFRDRQRRCCNAKNCVRSCATGWQGVFTTCGCAGGDGGEGTDPGQPTAEELKDAGVKPHQTKAEEEPTTPSKTSSSKTGTDGGGGDGGGGGGEAAAANPDEGGGGLSAWFGSFWGDDSDEDDDDDDEGEDGAAREAATLRRLSKKGRKQDPMLVKLRFRRYADHVTSYD